MHKSPGTDQIPAKFINSGGRIIRSEIHKLIISIWNRQKFPEESIIVPNYKKDDKTDCNKYINFFFLPTTYKTLSTILLSRLTPFTEEIIGVINMDFKATGQPQIVYPAFVKYLKKWEYNKAVHQLFIDLKNSYVSVRRKILYNILIEFSIPI
jgi:hypothetical protein